MGDIIKRAKDTGEPRTLRHGRCGKKSKTTRQDVKVMIRNSLKNSKKTGKDLQKDLELAGVNVASSTVRRRLFEVGSVVNQGRQVDAWLYSTNKALITVSKRIK